MAVINPRNPKLKIEGIEIILQNRPEEYPDGLYFYNFLNDSLNEIGYKKMKLIFQQIAVNLKEKSKAKVFFHPLTDNAIITVKKFGARLEENHSPFTKILNGEKVLVPLMSITVDELEERLF